MYKRQRLQQKIIVVLKLLKCFDDLFHRKLEYATAFPPHACDGMRPKATECDRMRPDVPDRAEEK